MATRIEPIINGHRYSGTSVELDLGDLIVLGIKAMNYSDSLKPGVIRGSGPRKVGRTVGVSEPKLEIEMYRAEWDVVRQTLAARSASGIAFGTVVFDVRVSFHEPATQQSPAIVPRLFTNAAPSVEQTVMDVISHCRITDVEMKPGEGAEPATVLLTCDPMAIVWGGATGQVIEDVLSAGNRPPSDAEAPIELDAVTGAGVG